MVCEAWLFPVPLWPDLRFEVLLAPNGAVWNEWLIRAPEAEGPDLKTLADLTPWSCTVDEAARAFAPARPLEGTAPTRWGWPSRPRTGRGCGGRWRPSSRGGCCSGWRSANEADSGLAVLDSHDVHQPTVSSHVRYRLRKGSVPSCRAPVSHSAAAVACATTSGG